MREMAVLAEAEVARAREIAVFAEAPGGPAEAERAPVHEIEFQPVGSWARQL